MSKIYKEGIEAYHSGEDFIDCPYSEEWQIKEWRLGFYDAENCSDM
jgi:hypothetical protein